MESEIPTQSQEQQALGDIRGILDGQRFSVLSSLSDGQPYLNLVAFSEVEDLQRIIFCTPRATRKYANLHCDPRAAMLFHNSHNEAMDCTEAMSLTVTGTVVEVPGERREVDAAVLISRHPDLAGFVGDPENALMSFEISEYHLVRRFQDVIRISALRADDSSPTEGLEGALRPGTAAILLAHGSRDGKWREWFEQFAASLAGSLGEGRVRAAYLQLASPTLLEAVTAAAEEGFRQIAVLPLFISAGGHVMRDVPLQVSAVQEKWDDLEITVLPRVGEERGFVELVRQLVFKAIAVPTEKAIPIDLKTN